MKKTRKDKEKEQETIKLRERAKQLIEFANVNTGSIKEAKSIFMFLANDIDGKFQEIRTKMSVSELGLEPNEEKEKFDALMGILSDLSVTKATALLEGLVRAIDWEVDHTLCQKPMTDIEIKLGNE